MIDGETEKKKRGRKSRLKLQKEDKLEEKPTQPLTPSEASEKKKYGIHLFQAFVQYIPSIRIEI